MNCCIKATDASMIGNVFALILNLVILLLIAKPQKAKL